MGGSRSRAPCACRPDGLDSARWIFGDTLGDPTADEICALANDRPAGVTRSEVRDLFTWVADLRSRGSLTR